MKDSVATRTNGHKLAVNKFRLEIKRKFLTIKGVRNSLPIGVMESNNLTSFKMELDKLLNGII